MNSIQKIIDFLKTSLERPSLFIGTSDNLEIAGWFILGFNSACSELGLQYSPEIETAVFETHGFERESDGVHSQLKRSGLTAKGIVALMIQLEIEKWELKLEESIDPVAGGRESVLPQGRRPNIRHVRGF
jgi:hypothetical protein